MLFNDKNFKVMQSGLDALWIKQKVVSNNIANYETPGFKASKVSFYETLSNEIINGKVQKTSNFNVKIEKDDSTSNRLDGNNVDMENEQLALWDTYAQYSYLTQKVSGTLKNMRYVINNSGK